MSSKFFFLSGCYQNKLKLYVFEMNFMTNQLKLTVPKKCWFRSWKGSNIWTLFYSVLEDTHTVSALCRQEGAVPPPSLQLSACDRVLARSNSSRDGLRLRLSRTGLGDDCHSVSCTLTWQGTNLTQKLTRDLLHSNKYFSSAGEQQHLQHVRTLIKLCLSINSLKQ